MSLRKTSLSLKKEIQVLNFNKLNKKDVVDTLDAFRYFNVKIPLEVSLIAARFNAGTQRNSDAKRFTKFLLLNISAMFDEDPEIKGARDVSKECKKVLKKEWKR